MNDEASHPWSVTDSVDPAAADCDWVRRWLREHNWQFNRVFMEQLEQPGHQSHSLVVLASEGARVIGGLLAETQSSWLRISIMAVDPTRRSQGIGAALLARAEAKALLRGCKYAFADTMEYQAPWFYRRYGFTLAGTIPDWDSRGHAKYYFHKTLSSISASH